MLLPSSLCVTYVNSSSMEVQILATYGRIVYLDQREKNRTQPYMFSSICPAHIYWAPTACHIVAYVWRLQRTGTPGLMGGGWPCERPACIELLETPFATKQRFLFFFPCLLSAKNSCLFFLQVPSVFRWQPVWHLSKNPCRQNRFPQTFGFQCKVSKPFSLFVGAGEGVFIFKITNKKSQSKHPLSGTPYCVLTRLRPVSSGQSAFPQDGKRWSSFYRNDA